MKVGYRVQNHFLSITASMLQRLWPIVFQFIASANLSKIQFGEFISRYLVALLISALLGLGFDGLILRSTGNSHHNEEPSFSNALRAFVIVTPVVFGSLLVIWQWDYESVVLVIAMAASIFLANVTQLVLIAHTRYVRQFSSVVAMISSQIIFILLIPAHNGTGKFIWASTLGFLVIPVINIVFLFFSVRKELRIRRHENALRTALPLAGHAGLVWLISYFDRYYVAYILGASMLAEYQITVLVSGSVIILFEITQNVNVKIISSVEVSNKSQIAKEIFEANYRLFISTTGTAFSIFIICQATETYFFELFNPSIALLILLAMVGKFIYLETSALLISSKNTKPIFQGSFVAMLSIVVGSMVLVPFWGAYGAATATAAALSIQAIVSSAFVSKIGSFGMELKKFIGSCACLLIFLHLETRVAIEFTFLSLIAFFLCSVYFGIKFVKFYRGHKVPNSTL